MIENQQAIQFVQQARTAAGAMGTLRRTLAEFMVRIPTFESLTSGDLDADVINDFGVNTQPVTKLNVAQLKYRVEQVLASLEQDDGEAVVARFAPSSIPLF